MKGRIKGSGRGLIRGRREMLDVTRLTVYEGLELLPVDRSYRNMDLHLDAQKKLERRLLKMMRPLSAEYELLLMDCAPDIASVDRRKRMRQQFIESPPRALVEFMQAYIPYSSDIERMSLPRGLPMSYSAASRAGQSFVAWWKEMEQGLQRSA